VPRLSSMQHMENRPKFSENNLRQVLYQSKMVSLAKEAVLTAPLLLKESLTKGSPEPHSSPMLRHSTPYPIKEARVFRAINSPRLPEEQ